MPVPRPRHRMIDRIAEILELVARARVGVTLSEIARQIDAPLSSTQGLVNGLVSTGYLDETDKKYTLGVTPYILNQLAGRGTLNRINHNDLVKLRDDTGFTAYLSVGMGDSSIYLDHVSDESDEISAFVASTHRKRPLLHSSAGWLMLAARQDRDIWAYLNRIDDDDEARKAFLQALPAIRADNICSLPGYSYERGQDGISVPLRDHGKTVAAVGLMGPRAALVAREDELKRELLAQSRIWHERA